MFSNNKKLFQALLSASLLASASAGATPMTFTDRANPNPDQTISFGNNQSYSFTHSIIADQDGAGSYWSGNYGFNVLTDSIIDATLALRFKDESNDTAPESVKFTFDLSNFGTQTITSGGATYIAFFQASGIRF